MNFMFIQWNQNKNTKISRDYNLLRLIRTLRQRYSGRSREVFFFLELIWKNTS
jgi:hypothetical protein